MLWAQTFQKRPLIEECKLKIELSQGPEYELKDFGFGG